MWWEASLRRAALTVAASSSGRNDHDRSAGALLIPTHNSWQRRVYQTLSTGAAYEGTGFFRLTA